MLKVALLYSTFITMISPKIKTLFIEIVSALVIFLFIYASVSKIIDYQKFKIQLGQSPILTSLAGFTSWFIPAIEILVSILLILPRYRLAGLYASFSLMAMFSAYIVAITKYSEFIPCSCGGVLQHMNWNEHLIFNLVFFTLIASSIMLFRTKSNRSILLQ
jgi:uncharacterized membrane protein YphA (DoxX/SURF4 family)